MDLLELLPHRPPALCIDAVLETGPRHARCRRCVPEAQVDGQGLLPEPWVIEGLAQTGAVFAVAEQRGRGQRTARGMLVGVRNMDFLAPIPAGAELEFRTELVKTLGALSLMRGEAFLAGRCVARGQLKFHIEELPA